MSDNARQLMIEILSPKTIKHAEQHLAQSCSVMAGLIVTHGRCAVRKRDLPPFQTLANAIIGQQLSVKAAATIGTRVLALAPDFTPREVSALSPEALRAAGLSAAKARYIKDLAQRVSDGALDFDAIAKQPDEDAISSLINVPGIGRWTAEMFLIFALKRPNVMTLNDAGLQRATHLLYGEEADLKAISEAWQPYRSVASWYLWRHLDAPPAV